MSLWSPGSNRDRPSAFPRTGNGPVRGSGTGSQLPGAAGLGSGHECAAPSGGGGCCVSSVFTVTFCSCLLQNQIHKLSRVQPGPRGTFYHSYAVHAALGACCACSVGEPRLLLVLPGPRAPAALFPQHPPFALQPPGNLLPVLR